MQKVFDKENREICPFSIRMAAAEIIQDILSKDKVLALLGDIQNKYFQADVRFLGQAKSLVIYQEGIKEPAADVSLVISPQEGQNLAAEFLRGSYQLTGELLVRLTLELIAQMAEIEDKDVLFESLFDLVAADTYAMIEEKIQEAR